MTSFDHLFEPVVDSKGSREVIAKFEADGWALVVTGSHHHYTHPTKSGK